MNARPPAQDNLTTHPGRGASPTRGWWTVGAVLLSIALLGWCVVLALFAPMLAMMSDACGPDDERFICSVVGQWSAVLLVMIGAPLIGLVGVAVAWTRRSRGARFAALVIAGILATLTYPLASALSEVL